MPLVTFGHGTLGADELTALLHGAGVARVVDVRSHPGSRRHPHIARDQLERWLPEAGVAYRWEPRLGGRRRTHAGSPHVALRNDSFRGYADHMEDPDFAAALDEVLAEADAEPTTVLCAEAVWWRCHRRLVADAATLLRQADVRHLMHDGTLTPHALTEGVRRSGDRLVYDVDADRPLPL